MITKKALPRRTFLRGVGAAIGLPFLDAMAPAMAAAPKAPVRMGFVYVPNGMDVRNWNLDYEGKLGVHPLLQFRVIAFLESSVAGVHLEHHHRMRLHGRSENDVEIPVVVEVRNERPPGSHRFRKARLRGHILRRPPVGQHARRHPWPAAVDPPR